MIYRIAILFNDYLSVTFGNTARGGGETTQTIGHHVVVRGNLHTAKTDAIEKIAPGITVPNGQFVFYGNERVLHITADILPSPWFVLAIAPGGVIA